MADKEVELTQTTEKYKSRLKQIEAEAGPRDEELVHLTNSITELNNEVTRYRARSAELQQVCDGLEQQRQVKNEQIHSIQVCL